MEGEKFNGGMKNKAKVIPPNHCPKEVADEDRPYTGRTEQTQVEHCILHKSVGSEGNQEKTKAL